MPGLFHYEWVCLVNAPCVFPLAHHRVLELEPSAETIRVLHSHVLGCVRRFLGYQHFWIVALAMTPEEDTAAKGRAGFRPGECGSAMAVLTAVSRNQPKHRSAFLPCAGGRTSDTARHQESVMNLDKHVELEPKAESRQCSGGFAYYYAGQFVDGAQSV